MMINEEVTLYEPLLQRYRVESYATSPQHFTSPLAWHVADPTDKKHAVIKRWLKPCSQQTIWTELNCSARTAALQPINFVRLTRATNNASCNWVSLVQVSSVQFSWSIYCEHGFVACHRHRHFLVVTHQTNALSCLRTPTTWHCRHSYVAAIAINRYLLPAGPTVEKPAARYCNGRVGQTDGYANGHRAVS